MKYFYIALFLSLIIIGGLYAYKLYNDSIFIKQTDFIENNEFKSNKNSTNVSQIYLFYVDWCPHSNKALKSWQILKKDPEFKQYNLYFNTIDCEKDTVTCQDFNIKEYPTIVLVKDSKNYIYDANLEEKSFKLFLKQVFSI